MWHVGCFCDNILCLCVVRKGFFLLHKAGSQAEFKAEEDWEEGVLRNQEDKGALSHSGSNFRNIG